MLTLEEIRNILSNQLPVAIVEKIDGHYEVVTDCYDGDDITGWLVEFSGGGYIPYPRMNLDGHIKAPNYKGYIKRTPKEIAEVKAIEDVIREFYNVKTPEIGIAMGKLKAEIDWSRI